jgi:hypothetical protein
MPLAELEPVARGMVTLTLVDDNDGFRWRCGLVSEKLIHSMVAPCEPESLARRFLIH